MFTGLIQSIGTVVDIRKSGGEADLDVQLAPETAAGERLGGSIALAGVCCTLVALAGTVGTFHLSAETLRRTRLGELAPGARLNVECALRAGEPLGGHLVQGHVDGLGRVAVGVDPEAGGELVVEVPESLQRYCVPKGSLTVDGVSLTVAAIDGDRVTIALIPHTARMTTLGAATAGDPVHLEADVIGKYVERLLAARFDP